MLSSHSRNVTLVSTASAAAYIVASVQEKQCSNEAECDGQVLCPKEVLGNELGSVGGMHAI